MPSERISRLNVAADRTPSIMVQRLGVYEPLRKCGGIGVVSALRTFGPEMGGGLKVRC